MKSFGAFIIDIYLFILDNTIVICLSALDTTETHTILNKDTIKNSRYL